METIHPIRIVDNVLEEYRSFLLTEFRARDARLRKALEEAIKQPRFLAQDTFYQAHRPFMKGKRWNDLALDARLAETMQKRSDSNEAYTHQSEAIMELLATPSRPVVVTTGTGSGKTECFLLPVIQNAIEDVVRFSQQGLTAILVYPMNALANDQEKRIAEYLKDSGHTSVVVKRYDRTTSSEDRELMRRKPPHILLTNYMMLEYLLVRPADRDAIFSNHRCRFVVLDEVHTYRGSLGTNIALLFRRLRAHLEEATQDWQPDRRDDPKRFPQLTPVATSATIKSVDETGRKPEEVRALRDKAVQDFVGKLTGFEPSKFRVIGEERKPLVVPSVARWSSSPKSFSLGKKIDDKEAKSILIELTDANGSDTLDQVIAQSAALWKLHELLAQKPMSVEQAARKVIETVAQRKDATLEEVTGELEAAVEAGCALLDGTTGALRLRAHRFIRGGWRFERCVDSACGKLYPQSQEQCSCGKPTAPLYLCRGCGADTLRLVGAEDPTTAQLTPKGGEDQSFEWFLYDVKRLNFDQDDDAFAEGGETDRQMKKRPVFAGSYDPGTGSFSADIDQYPIQAVLAPARSVCLVCGASAGAGTMLTPVALGTSAAVRVISEGLLEALADEHRNQPDHDKKERLLIFADSRQDAAHQARFITYAGRYDRMRRRIVQFLTEKGGAASYTDAVKGLMELGVAHHDNPHTVKFDSDNVLPKPVQAKAAAWEEAPLLDDIAISAGFRSTVFNLGLVGVRYEQLSEQVNSVTGRELAKTLGITSGQLGHLARCLLDEMRTKKAFGRPLVQYHPLSPSTPDESKTADWERRVASPNGFACDDNENVIGSRDKDEIPRGINLNNSWRRSNKGRAPSIERKFRVLLERFHSPQEITEEGFLALIKFLMPTWIQPFKLYGHRDTISLLQVNPDAVELVLLKPEERMRCNVCNVRIPWAVDGAPCPACHGSMAPWPSTEVDTNRFVQRIRKFDMLPLVAGEHTAQLTGDARLQLEEEFKGPPLRSALNVLACSPTLEMGIDVGGLDSVVMRNVPPRPDNYAQRGGRAGRRSRVGVVLSYARSTPHDAYFFDKPEEMIAGEVPAPVFGLGNRDIVLRHLGAIAFGLAEPGLKGRMAEYIEFSGAINETAVSELLTAVTKEMPKAARIAWGAWGNEILEAAGFRTMEELTSALDALPERIRDAFARVSRQVIQLQSTIDQWGKLEGISNRKATSAMDLKRRILGTQEKGSNKSEADDRSSGHPMRRFAEFGILPGYEFPTEPATIRLLGDANEEDPISVERRFGISQYEPDAIAHARGHRWRVRGLDLSSPWNPKSSEPTWLYNVCANCKLRFETQKHVKCPRCLLPSGAAQPIPGYEFGGFLATRDDTPVLEEEDRFARADRVRVQAQRDGRVLFRYELNTGWRAQLSQGEEVRWVNEYMAPTAPELARGAPVLHSEARGFYLCPHCGRLLNPPAPANPKKSNKKPRNAGSDDPYGHTKECEKYGRPPASVAIVAGKLATVLRIQVSLPLTMEERDYQRWGQSLGQSLRTGMRQLYMLDGSEIDFVLEDLWDVDDNLGRRKAGALTFIDAAVGGSGFLDRAIEEFHLVARRTLEHLDHKNCESACYRCLKSYNNQRVHELLNWPAIVSDLEALAEAPPEKLPPDIADDQDPKPWLEAFAAGVGSPLELKFLRLFEQNGIEVDKQVPVVPDEGGHAISTADFVVKGTKVAIDLAPVS